MYENERHLYHESNAPSRFESKMCSVVIYEDYLREKYEERIVNSHHVLTTSVVIWRRD